VSMFNIKDFGGFNYHNRTRLSRQKMNPHSVSFTAITGSSLLKFLDIRTNCRHQFSITRKERRRVSRFSCLKKIFKECERLPAMPRFGRYNCPVYKLKNLFKGRRCDPSHFYKFYYYLFCNLEYQLLFSEFKISICIYILVLRVRHFPTVSGL